MLWILVVIFFGTDGSRTVSAKVEPTESACKADVEVLVTAIKADKPADLLGAGFKCDGPLDDPTVKKTGA